MKSGLYGAMRTGRLVRCACAALIVILLVAGMPATQFVHADKPDASQVDEIELRVQTPAYELDPQGIRVPGYGFNDDPGMPLLPVWSTTVELPATGTWRITSTTPGSRVVSVASVLPAVPVPNMPPAPPEGWNPDNGPTAVPVADRPDPRVYLTNGFYPESAVVAGSEQWQRGRRMLAVRVFPFQYNPVAGVLRYHPDVHVTIRITPGESTPPDNVQPSVVPAVPDDVAGALRIYTTQRGLHRLTYDDLVTAGVPVTTTSPATFAMTYLGQPIDIQVTGEGDGAFDPGDLVVFYAEPYQGRYMNQNVYWFTYGGSPGPRMTTRTVTPSGAEPVVTVVTQTVHVEFDRDYRSLYNRPMTADHFFDTQLYANASTPTVTRVYDLPLDDAITSSGSVILRTVVFGGQNQAANPDQSMAVRLNSHAVGTFQWDGSTEKTTSSILPATWLDGTPNQVIIDAALSQLAGVAYYWISPDWVELTYQALADAEGDRMFVEAVAPGASEIVVSGFTAPGVGVYDVRNPRQPVELMTAVAEPVGGGYSMHFWDAALPNPTYYLSTDAALLAPASIVMDTSSNWQTPGHTADYIAIVHSSLWEAVQPLLDHRAAEGLAIAKVNIQDIYDEFSGGRVDPEAIRSFLFYAYQNWNAGLEPPTYVLLVGDGHYDFKGVTGTTLPNLIPPYLVYVDPWLGETAADNRFVSLDGPSDFLPELHIGRIPAKTAADVTNVVQKILTYESVPTQAEWQRRVVFVADNYSDPAGNFHALSNDIRDNWLPDEYVDVPIYYNGNYFTGNDMRTAIRTALNQDALMLQWFGHASRFRWGSVSMFNINDPPALAANSEWPVTVSYSCWSGYFINLDSGFQSLGEALLLTAQRGGIADISPSGLHVGSALQKLNQAIVKSTLQNRIERIGAAFDAAKSLYYAQASGSFDVIDTQLLFGDPALKLKLPAPDVSSFTASVDRTSVVPGEILQYTVAVTNTGIMTATNAVLEADYPESLSSVVNAGGANDDGQQLTWPAVTLAPAASQVVTFSLVADAVAPPGIYTITVPVRVSTDELPTITRTLTTTLISQPDLSTSTLAVNTANAQAGETLVYTVTLDNTSAYTVSSVSVALDYDQDHGQVVTTREPPGVAPPLDTGGVLTWTVPALPPGATELGLDLQLNANFPTGVTTIHAPTAIRVNGQPGVDLDVTTQVDGPPFAFSASLGAGRAWVPPGQAVTYTLFLASNAGTAALAQTEVTLTVPAALSDPIALGGSIPPPVFDPPTRRVTWQGPVFFQQPVALTVTSIVTSSLTSCGRISIAGQVEDGAGGLRTVSSNIDLAVPDVNCSGAVNIVDVQRVAARFGAVVGDGRYHGRYDLDGNDTIDVLDIVIVAQAWQ